MYLYIFISLFIIFISSITIYLIYQYNNNNKDIVKLDKPILYEKLMKDFNKIFPDRNRNSGGVQFFKHIIDNLNPSKKEFDLYNQFYCAVSGSPIDPKRKDIKNLIVMKDLNNNNICGDYYRCCIPCNCDLMKYAKVEKMNISLRDGNYNYHVLTINDPCQNESEIPDSVSSFKCNNNKTINGIHAPSGRLIVGILHNSKLCSQSDLDKIHTSDITGKFCKERNSTDPDNLRGGMGDIFVKLSLIGDMDSSTNIGHNNLKNIYGEPLKKCQKYPDDMRGSWDNNGYCSELGGGVHQICFDVNNNSKDFSKDTGQSNWSESRVGKNHCMCLGAWSLYKAKQNNDLINETYNELNCEAIPEMSLNESYVGNWNTWNGNELDDQIIDGVNSLMEQCYEKGNNNQKIYLKNKYNELTNSRSEFHNTETYNKYNI